MIKPEEAWWKRVPVAVNFIEQCIADALALRPSYVDSRKLPWASKFMKMTEKTIRDKSQLYTVFTIDGAQFNRENQASILDLMVEGLGYIQNYDSTIQSVGRELNDSIIFFLVKATDKDQLNELKKIAKDAEQEQINLRLIVLTEVGQEDLEVQSFKYYNNDIQAFILTLLLDKNCTDELLNYRVALATLLADHDAEKAAICCNEIDNCIYSPRQVCTWLPQEKVDARVRKAKIRFMMPDLEMARINFGKMVKDRFGPGTLPHKDIINGEIVSLSLEELEFRHFKYIAKDRRKLALYPDEKDMLKVLYAARNALAHIGNNDNVLTIDFIRETLRACERLENET